MSLPTLVFLAPAAVCALSWLGIGRLVPRRLLPDDLLLRVLTRFAVGATTFALVTYALGRAHAYWRPLLVAITVGGALAALPSLWYARRSLRIGLESRAERIAAALVGAALALDLVAASAPPTSADALKYHLALPKLWLQTGAVGDAFSVWESFNPFSVEMLYGQGLAVAGGEAASAVGALIGVGAVAAIYGLGRELGRGSRLAGLAAAGLFALQGIVTWTATSVFVELGLTSYAVLGVWYALRFFRGGAAGDLAWAGVMGGCAAGTKYVGLQALLLPALLVLAGLRRRDLRVLAGALALTAVSGGGWYLKNALVTGNPVYPLYGFGKEWTPALGHALDALGHAYGVGHSVLRLAVFPAELYLHGGAFDRGQYVGPAIFVGAALALVLVRTRETFLLLGSVVLFAISWWYLSAQARFLLPALAILAALGGPAVVALYRRGRNGVVAVAIGTVAVAAVWIVPSVTLTRRAIPVVFGATSRRAYIERETGTYNAIRDAGGRSSGVLAFAGYFFPYYASGQGISLTPPEFAVDVPAHVFVARLHAERVRYVFSQGDGPPPLPQLRGCLEPVALYHARLVTSRSLGTSVPMDFRLYRLRPPCVP
jgi:hypothetical protein